MAFDFPTSPVNGQEAVFGSVVYVWNGYGWAAKGNVAADFVTKSTAVIAGAGLTGGGDLSTSRTLDVGAGTGITVNADNVALTTPVSIANGGTGTTTGISTATQTALDGKVAKVGDTMTGDLTINKDNAGLALRKPSAPGATYVAGYTAANLRWLLHLGDFDSESGANSGSNFRLIRYNDAGVQIGDPALLINRATGAATLGSNVIFGNIGYQIGSSFSGAGVTVDASNNVIFKAHLSNTTYFQNFNQSVNYGSIGSTGWNVATTTPSTSPTTGALTVAGGLGVGETVSIGLNTPTFRYAIRVGYAGGSSTQFGIGLRPAVDSTTVIGIENAAGAGVGSITQSSTATAYNTTSDAALKEDLKSFDAGNIIDNTNVYDFKWKSTQERAYGIIAQEAVEVYPTAITHTEKNEKDNRDEWWGVDYSKYVPVLLQELKASRKREKELIARIEALETKVASNG